ncbi:hypothetical protein DESUT3_36360 [Desulfuromonas versatilis]|uniref:Hydrogenase maturation protease n=1 Tax=Desulfuromonas versatilis TaxID=2802975 RepID=A0ABM8I1J6_9BACT|nr:hydrogenase maturation protease [Desulfuromonas versatilis]BCR06567.1 hypothetical protein DESUT3_36360 [Desulfuromonas versatilis]
MPETTRLIGVGNPLMGDDGIGIAAAERLAAMVLPEGVEVIDGGTGGLTLLTLMDGADRVVLVDAVEMGKVPGSLVRFTPEEVVAADAGGGGLSLHETGLAQVLALGRELGCLPEKIVIFGVQPESVSRQLGLSPPVAAALEPLLAQLLRELGGY